MAAIEHRARHVALKVGRAKEHLAELRKDVAAYLAGAPYKVGAKRDTITRSLVYFVESAAPIPDRIPLLAGDGIQNLMSALDHLAYQLVGSDTEDRPPSPNRIYFPIADDATAYESKKRDKMAGATAETLSAIDALRPYKGGNDALWRLYRLNNIEKHRLLLTVGSQAAGIHLGQMVAPHLRQTFPPEAVAQIEAMNVFIHDADSGFPLRPGFELYITAPDEEPNPKLQFRFTVALAEADVVEGVPLIETIEELVASVDGVVAALTPRLR